MSSLLHRAVTWLLPLVAVSYLGYVAAGLELSEVTASLSARTLGIALTAALLYGAGLYLLAYAWSTSLQQFARPAVNPEAAMQLYAFSTFAKYLPGNVFHYAGRQIAAARLGYGQKAPAQATMVEILGHIVAVGLLLLLLLPFSSEGVSQLLSLAASHLQPWVIAVALVLLAVASGGLLVPKLRRFLPPLDLRLAGFLALLQVSFFALAALLGLWLAIAILDLPATDWPFLIFVYLTAWLIGFVTPGAPGGLGVREACLLAGLGGLAGAEAILVYAGVTRLSFLLGEGFFALSGFLLRPRPAISARRHPGVTP